MLSFNSKKGDFPGGTMAKNLQASAGDNVKYLDIYLSTHVQDLPAENYKILIKGIKVYLDKWRYI